MAALGIGAAWAADPPADARVDGAASSQPAQDSASPVVSPASLFPEMGPTLSANPSPANLDLGSWFGRLYVTGAVSGLGLWQSNPFPDDNRAYADIANGMVFLQTASAPVQFVVQAGIYSIPTLGEPYTRAADLNGSLWGPVPQAYVKLVPTDSFSVQIGRLPSLLGVEPDFTFQNVNIARGLLWNQENSINQGIQLNYTTGPLDLSVSLNDGFFTGRFNWLTGAATYTIDDNNAITFSAGGSFGSNREDSFRSPLAQSNSTIYNLIYEYTSGPWTVTPYVQYTHVPNDSALRAADFTQAASTIGVAAIASYSFNENWKLGARGEYISSSGSFDEGAPELVTGGPGAKNWSITVTPSFQYDKFFARGEVSYVGLDKTTPGFAFGSSGNDTSQVRVLFEAGVIF
ncbi:MAG: porin [Rhodospirillales bacterium]|nr:porin [Rhodospirillales bacterium]